MKTKITADDFRALMEHANDDAAIVLTPSGWQMSTPKPGTEWDGQGLALVGEIKYELKENLVPDGRQPTEGDYHCYACENDAYFTIPSETGEIFDPGSRGIVVVVAEGMQGDPDTEIAWWLYKSNMTEVATTRIVPSSDCDYSPANETWTLYRTHLGHWIAQFDSSASPTYWAQMSSDEVAAIIRDSRATMHEDAPAAARAIASFYDSVESIHGNDVDTSRDLALIYNIVDGPVRASLSSHRARAMRGLIEKYGTQERVSEATGISQSTISRTINRY